MTSLLRNLLIRDHPLRRLAATVLAEMTRTFGGQLPTQSSRGKLKSTGQIPAVQRARFAMGDPAIDPESRRQRRLRGQAIGLRLATSLLTAG